MRRKGHGAGSVSQGGKRRSPPPPAPLPGRGPTAWGCSWWERWGGSVGTQPRSPKSLPGAEPEPPAAAPGSRSGAAIAGC